MSQRLTLVGFTAADGMSPRAARAAHVSKALSPDWTVELLLPHIKDRSGRQAERWSPDVLRSVRKSTRRIIENFLLDKREISARRNLRGDWPAHCDAAYLLCPPFSPALLAAKRLVRAGVPYIVDAGDPYLLTFGYLRSRGRFARARGLREEQLLWENASGAVLTTKIQADALANLFPELPVLVRPNGYLPLVTRKTGPSRPSESTNLTLAHFGNMYEPRLDAAPFLESLATAGPWHGVRLIIYGSDWGNSLTRLPREVNVDFRPQVPWASAVGVLEDVDAVIAVGNRTGVQLPSKAIEYLSLPVPRLALVTGANDDALATYASRQPGWLCLDASAEVTSDVANRVNRHVKRSWTAEDLAPPPGEAWSNVANEIATFATSCLKPHGSNTDTKFSLRRKDKLGA